MSTDDVATPDEPSQDLTPLTTVPVAALGQPLKDFLAAHGISAFVTDDDTGLDATRSAEVLVPEHELERAKALLEDYWAANEGPRNVM